LTLPDCRGDNPVHAGKGEVVMTTVSSGQILTISDGQTSSGIIVLSGGILDVLSGGTVINTVDSGTMKVESGGTGSNTVTYSGNFGVGGEVVLSGGTETGATVSTFGGLTVSSGGIADDATVLNACGELLGNYTAASFTKASDGGAGTLITDTAVSPGPAAVAATPVSSHQG
jgi:autotransporter passenger strand-loop-strand repeat protein